VHCNVCPAYPLVEALVELKEGKLHPRLDEAMLKRDELSQRCIACHLKARKNDKHLGGYDRDGGKLHGEISFDDRFFALGQEQGDFTSDPTYLASLRRDGSTGCSDLDPEVEDLLRKAISVIVEGVEVKDSSVLLALLKREPLKNARPKKLARREFVACVRRVLLVLGRAKSIIEHGDTRQGITNERVLALTRQAAAKLIDSLGSMLTPCDAPTLLGMMQGLSLADTARAAELKNRATAHARARSMLERMPQLKPLHTTATKRH